MTEIDRKNLIMIFQHEGRTVVIKGDPSLMKANASVKCMMRTWYPNDQGILIACRALEGSLTIVVLYDEREVHYNKGVGGTNQL